MSGFLPYRICLTCNSITDKWLEMAITDFPCPACNSTSDGWSRMTWPKNFFPHILFPVINDFLNEEQEEKWKTAGVLVCVCAESILKELLSEIIIFRTSDKVIEESLLNRIKGFKDGVELFKELTGQSLKDAICALGYSDFYDNLKTITQARNKFVHGNFFGFEKDDEVKIKNVFNNILKVFQGLHNSFCSKKGR